MRMPTSTATLAIITSWLDRCVASHKCQHDAASVPRRIISVGTSEHPSLRLIETNKDHVDDGESGRYIALSYCWGSGQSCNTTRANCEARTRSIDEELLPQTIKDAIFLTRRLRTQYLWIDSLCILQDHPEDWASESAKMGQYYGNAFITISASNSCDSRHGFLHSRRASAVVKVGTVELRHGEQNEETDILVSVQPTS